ncbi:hypothetical protein [Mesorhizobium sp.]|uniref:hypothetical protein n=1 Tax=Mesorhizobium sp. TaxID=1871066 RepID=UPI000FE3FC57|nr:hypothetical protein [Mesorhizobium sp.]RWN52720.1 MAG: hypothetical protein EOR98_20975 [Mesorhizobium sp.]RWN78435.1 MAG: hypothetical protein EOS01_16590 [Mesorhizobium sp.]RWN81039.1 MAG: hypothetical protein EOS02_03960 [Mesorhizobium sp.]RWN85822.1 MAG: hypothetical protein EOS04_21125 [Mesorhizobium sp.]RWO16247.1 MAG: hypothetical protein EOS15_04415 [Mesorhizobium sp.]
MIDLLPKGWSRASLGDLVKPIETTDPSRWDRESFMYVDIGSIDNETKTIRSPKLVMSKAAPSEQGE